jgi:hypothetical protein
MRILLLLVPCLACWIGCGKSNGKPAPAAAAADAADGPPATPAPPDPGGTAAPNPDPAAPPGDPAEPGPEAAPPSADPAALLARLPPLPEALVRDGFVPPPDVAAFAARFERPAERLLANDDRFLRWSLVPFGGCAAATVDLERSEAGARAAQSLTVSLEPCAEHALAWLALLGHPGSPPAAGQEIWLFREGAVTFRTQTLELRIERWAGSRLEVLQRPDAAGELEAGLERMRQPPVAWALDTADPVAGTPAFQQALLSGDPRLLAALAWPFADGRTTLARMDEGAPMMARLTTAREALRGKFERATLCRGGTLAELAAGAEFPWLDRLPERPRKWEAVAHELRALDPQDDDFLVSCAEPEGSAQGLLFAYRKQGELWRPCGYLD